MIDRVTRWVERKGRIVRFGNIVGAFVGRAYVYEFPDVALARTFERVAKRVGPDGTPVPIPPETWGLYRKEPV